MAENPKWVLDFAPLSLSCEAELGDFMGTQKIEISHQNQTFLNESRASDSFVVDIESLSHDHGLDEEDIATTPTNSKITVNMQRSLRKKESQRNESKTSAAVVASCDAANGPSNEKSIISPRILPSKGEEGINTQVRLVQQQTERMANIDNYDGKYTWPKRYCKQRSSARLINPRRVLFFFATLSSLGTIILIYFSLSC